MNFVRSSQTYHSTDVSHVKDLELSHRQGFGGGSPRWNNPGQNRYNRPMGPISGFGNKGSFNPGFGGPQRFDTLRGNSPKDLCELRQHFGARGGRQSMGVGNPSPGANSNLYANFLKREQQAYGTSTENSGVVKQERWADPTQYGGFVKPQRAEDHFEGVDSQAPNSRPGLGSGCLLSHPYSRSQLSSGPGSRTTGRFSPNIEGGGPVRGASGRGAGFRGRGLGPRLGSVGRGSASSSSVDLVKIEAATKAAAKATREAINPNAKCIVLASDNPLLASIKRLANAVKTLKSKRPNAVDTIHSASNIVQVKIQSEIESGPVVRGTVTFFCLVQFDGVDVAVGTGLNKRAAKIDAFDIAMQKLDKKFQRIVEVDGTTKELQASDYDFPAEQPKQTVVKPTSAVMADIGGEDILVNPMQKESNVEVLLDSRKKSYEAKELNDFVIVEPQEHNSSTNGASILRRSADFSKMLLEYDFACSGSTDAVRCVCKVEGQVLADCVGSGKVVAKNRASQIAIDKLRKPCFTILTKQHCDSDTPEITKDDMFADFDNSMNSNAASMSTPIGDSNLGKKLLQKMGWTGGGIGKDGIGIEEPITMKQVINREGLGLAAQRGIPDGFRQRVIELLENYASSERQDDLVFAPHFRNEERIIIHKECRRLNLKSKSKGIGSSRFLVVRRKRSVFQLLDHLMDIGGESPRYKLVPPGQRVYPWRIHEPSTPTTLPATSHAPAHEDIPAQPGGILGQASHGRLSNTSNAGRGISRSPGSVFDPGSPGRLGGQNSPGGLSGPKNPSGLLGQKPSAGQNQSGQGSMDWNLNRSGLSGPAAFQNPPSGFQGQILSMGQTKPGSFMGQKQNTGGFGGQTPLYGGFTSLNTGGCMGQIEKSSGFMCQPDDGYTTAGGFWGQSQNPSGFTGQNFRGYMDQMHNAGGFMSPNLRK